MTGNSNFQIYLSESLFLLKKSCRRKDTNITETIDSVLNSLKQSEKQLVTLDLEVFEPFKLACESRNTKLMAVSLDCIQNLVSTSLQSFPLEDPFFTHTKNKEKCIKQVLKIVCSCGLHPSDEIALKVVQNILTIISSSYDIHSEYLFFAIRTCFHLFLSTRSQLNKTCARATLAQIVHVIFDRSKCFFGLFDQLVTKKSKDALSQNGPFSKITVVNYEEVEFESSEVNRFFEENLKKEEKMCREVVLEIVRKRVLGDKPGKFGFCVNCRGPADHFCLQTNDSICSMNCKIENLESLIHSKKSNHKNRNFLSIILLTILYQNDTLLIFRSLCALANSNLEGIDLSTFNENSEKPVKLQSKELALDLIVHILKGSSDSIKKSRVFLTIIQKDLVSLLIQNVFEKYSNINGTAVAIFLELMRNFKTHLKLEIGVFLECILVKIIESKNSTYKQKLICIVVFLKICSSEQTLVDIFLNYDCNSDTFKIFNAIVGLLEKMTQIKLSVKDWISEKQETQLKLIGLRCITRLFQSMLSWAENAVNLQKKASDESEEASKKLGEEASKDIRGSEGFNVRYSEKKEKENILEKAIQKFNESPKMGIKMLKSVEIIRAESPSSTAHFLFKTPKLNKEAIGNYIGDASHEEILSAFVFQFDFKNLRIDVALRRFLNHFLLIGESQIIDRIMSKFAIKYCYDNPDVFSSSDSAHILAFSVIMLNTDLHSKNVADKMSCADFVKNNRSVLKAENMEEKYLEEVYERILAGEIKFDINEEGSRKEYLSPRSREKLFVEEESKIKEAAAQYVEGGEKGKIEKEYINTSKDNLDIIYRMFESVWSSTLASLSILLEKSENPSIVDICLKTYTCAIKLATVFKMDIIKEAYVNTLAGLTLLGTEKEMKPKNILAIRTILDVAYHEGNSLDKSWLTVMRCISHVEHLHLIGSGQSTDSEHFLTIDEKLILLNKSGIFDDGSFAGNGELNEDENLNSKAVAFLIEQTKIDRIFTVSESLHDEKIKTFFKHLCVASSEELFNKSGMRIYILEKIVETSLCNMHRKVEIWKEIWNDFSELFYKGGSAKNPNLAKYVINSYRVIITRFLNKPRFYQDEELQIRFFDPLLKIAQTSKKYGILEITLQCVFMLVQSVHNNLNSGWDSVIQIAAIAMRDSREKIADSGMNLYRLAITCLGDKLYGSSEILSAALMFLHEASESYLSQIRTTANETLFSILIKLSSKNNVLKSGLWQRLAEREKTPQNPLNSKKQKKSKRNSKNRRKSLAKKSAQLTPLKFGGDCLFLYGFDIALSFIFKNSPDNLTAFCAIRYLNDTLSHLIDRQKKEVVKAIYKTVLLPSLKTTRTDLEFFGENIKKVVPDWSVYLSDEFAVCRHLLKGGEEPSSSSLGDFTDPNFRRNEFGNVRVYSDLVSSVVSLLCEEKMINLVDSLLTIFGNDLVKQRDFEITKIYLQNILFISSKDCFDKTVMAETALKFAKAQVFATLETIIKSEEELEKIDQMIEKNFSPKRFEEILDSHFVVVKKHQRELLKPAVLNSLESFEFVRQIIKNISAADKNPKALKILKKTTAIQTNYLKALLNTIAEHCEEIHNILQGFSELLPKQNPNGLNNHPK